MAFLSRKYNSLIKVALFLIAIFCILTITLKISDDGNSENSNLQFQYFKNNKSLNKSLATQKEEVLYISRNEDSINNIKGIMETLGFEVYHLVLWYPPTKIPECYSNGECSSLITALCRKYKYIIINEVISDGYGYLNSICDSKIILEINNRFDVHVSKDRIKEFQSKLGNALKDENKDITLVLNSPYEDYYACKQGIFFPSYYVIRNSGFTNNVPDKDVERKDILAVFETTQQDTFIAKEELKKRDIPFVVITGKENNNPKVLSQYKAQIILPSKVTSTKIMENFRYGIVMMIPSQSFFREMMNEKQYSFEAKDIVRINDGLEDYTDWYNDDFEDLFVYFNSWDDIIGLIHSTNFDKVREKAMEFAQENEQKIIEQWKDILSDDKNKKYSVKHKKPICKSDEGFFYNYN